MAASMSLRVLELYSGIGGMKCALNESGINYEIVAAIDINTTANEIYRHNFPEDNNLSFGIEKLSLSQYNKWNINTILMSPPCQPFTRVGNKKDVNDIRTKSFLHILDILQQTENKPSYVLVENVKGFEESEARDRLIETLKSIGYCFQEWLLTPLQFGVPNCRLRYYMIAKLTTDTQFTFKSEQILTSIPECPEEWFRYRQSKLSELENEKSISDQWTELEKCVQNVHQVDDKKDNACDQCQRLQSFLEDETVNEDVNKEFLVNEKDFKLFIVMDIVHPGLRKSMCFTKRYGHYINGAGPILQMSHDLNDFKAVCQLKTKLTSETTRDWTDVETDTVRKLKLRYFTPREIANLLCFSPEFSFPPSLSRIQLYRCLGNSLNVHVVGVLIKLMLLDGTS